MSSNYQQKKMMNALGAIDTKGNIVLEQFQDGTALLFQPGNAQPFCVATDYDRATASWSYGKYFSDLGCAHEAADPEIIEDASVRWVKEDIREKLKAQDIAPTEFNVQSVIMGDSRLWERPLDRDFRDNMIASGNDDLDARVTILKEKPTAQGQVESSINDTINFIMAKVAAGEIDAATATELIAAARKDYESNVPVTTSAQQAVQLQQTANPYQADPQTAWAACSA